MCKYYTYLILVIISATFIACKNENKPSIIAHYPAYFQNSDLIISKFNKEQLNGRNEMLSELKQTQLYKTLVVDKKVSSNFLKILHITSSCIKDITKNGFTLSAQELSLMTDDENRFSSRICLLIGHHGGITSDIIEVFERYKNQFKLFGKEGTIYYNENRVAIDEVKTDFDISPFFAILDPKNKEVLNAIFEVRTLGIRKWSNETNDSESPVYSFLNVKNSYKSHLKDVYPSSKYLLEYSYSGLSQGLVSEYQENEVAADKKFKDVGLLIKGTVIRIMKDASGNNIIILLGNSPISSVYCKVSESDALKVSKGQRVEILGKCKGMVLGNVLLDESFLN